MRDSIQDRIRAHQCDNQHWVLPSPYSYSDLWTLDKREYYATTRNEWVQRVNESNILIQKLCTLHAL